MKEAFLNAGADVLQSSILSQNPHRFFFFSAAQTWRKILYVNILRESLGAEDTVGWGDAAKQTCLAGGKTRLPLIPFGVSKDQSE